MNLYCYYLKAIGSSQTAFCLLNTHYIMKGFELEYNNQKIAAGINDGVTTIFISKAENDIRLTFGGLDNDINQHVTWFESQLNYNDKVRIKAVEINQVAEVIKSKPNEDRSDKSKLAEYRSLKRYLEKEGLIEKDKSDGGV